MQLVQNQYNTLLESGAYDREHEAWPAFTVNEGQLNYLNKWLENRFNYLDAEINAACGTWEVEEIVENQIVEIFPNPAKDRINVHFSYAGEASARLYDMTGRLVYTKTTSEQDIVIPTQGLCKGVYNLVINAAASQQVSRVVVE